MSCPTSMVPGLDDSSKVKDKALAMKVNQLLIFITIKSLNKWKNIGMN